MEILLSHFVSKTPEQVHAYLSDMEKFVSLHPVITRMEPCKDGYRLFETLKFAGIPIGFSYPARIVSNGQNHSVQMLATVSGMVNIDISFELLAENEGTRINECINLKSFLPVPFFVKGIFRKQHLALFKNMEEI